MTSVPHFRVDDNFHAHRKVAKLGVEGIDAIGLWTLAGSWSADQLSDGWVPEYVAARLDPGYEGRAAKLVRVGLWQETERDGERGWQFNGWSEPGRNLTSEQVKAERAATADRQRRFRSRVKGTDAATERADDRNAVTNASVTDPSNGAVTDPLPFPSFPLNKDFSSLPASPDSDASPEDSAKGKPRKTEPYREDVERLCRRLVDLMVANECKPPTITDTWRAEARRLLDIDRRDFDKAMTLLEWSQTNPFWRKNIHSIPTFRDKYDRLRQDALDEWAKTHADEAESRPARPEWCGACDERTRMAGPATAPYRCPDCHPLTQKASTT